LAYAKWTLHTELDLIDGVWMKRTTELLETFGSTQGVTFATTQQLMDVVTEKVAGKLMVYFE
jgi:excinuclease UvrABC nuclease subunit